MPDLRTAHVIQINDPRFQVGARSITRYIVPTMSPHLSYLEYKRGLYNMHLECKPMIEQALNYLAALDPQRFKKGRREMLTRTLIACPEVFPFLHVPPSYLGPYVWSEVKDRRISCFFGPQNAPHTHVMLLPG